MRLVLSAMAGLIVAACEPPPPAATLGEIPEAFVGSWDRSAGDCGGGGSLAVMVAPKLVTFPDSHIDVTGVAPDGEIAVRVDGHFTSTMAEWDGSVRLELANGGEELNVVNGTPVSPRVKCP